jgi:hypothetical protein
MAQDVDHAPYNWPAAVLMFGWMLLGGAYIFGGQTEISTFGRGLHDAPLIWWPEMSGVGFAATMAPFILGGLSLLIMPLVDGSRSLGGGLIAVGSALLVFGIVWDIGSGVAVYPDRVVYRTSGWGAPTRTEYLKDITRIETACVSRRSLRTGRLPTLDYRARFMSGYDLWLARGSSYSWFAPQTGSRLRAVKAVDVAANAADAVRAPRRNIAGDLLGDRGCIDELAGKYGVKRQEIIGLFNVHRNQLRSSEYVTSNASGSN